MKEQLLLLPAHNQVDRNACDVSLMCQTRGSEHRSEVVAGVMRKEGLMEAHGERFEQAVPTEPVAHLQAVDKDEEAAHSQHPGDLRRYTPAHLSPLIAPTLCCGVSLAPGPPMSVFTHPGLRSTHVT